MPTYEYRCERGHQYETKEGFDAPAKQKCQQCGKPASRLLFAPPVVFKGSGFYKTDSSGSSGKTDSRGSSGKTDSGGSSSEDSDKAVPSTATSASTDNGAETAAPAAAPDKKSDAPAAESAAAS